ncbi:MAG TPA: phosphoribosylanthranilate isomerase [Bryobacteraceae bacterium]|nr:phosphoribosylanthranilate isomerase [Bryobacteraceae bacterium]
MMVKICGITNLDDALAAVEAGASAIGFNFYRESPRYISPTGAAMIGEKIPANVWKVGVFVDELPDTIARIVLEVGLDVAQLHGLSEARGVRIWQAISFLDVTSAALIPDEAEAVLIDSAPNTTTGGTGQTWNWRELPGLQRNIIIAGGLDPDNVRSAIEQTHPWGVDACSRLEKSPGLKDHEKMRKFIHAALHS